MMYSPEVGGAAPCEASAKIENKTTSQRRFISAAKGLFMPRAKLRKWEVVVAAGGDCNHPASVIPATTDLLPPLRSPDPPKSAVVESARTCRREQALRMATAANYNSKPSQIRRHQRS